MKFDNLLLRILRNEPSVLLELCKNPEGGTIGILSKPESRKLYKELQKKDLVQFILTEFSMANIDQFIDEFLTRYGLMVSLDDLIQLEINHIEHLTFANIEPIKNLAKNFHSEVIGDNEYQLEYDLETRRIFEGNLLIACISIKCACGNIIEEEMKQNVIIGKLNNEHPYGFYCPRCHNHFEIGYDLKEFKASIDVHDLSTLTKLYSPLGNMVAHDISSLANDYTPFEDQLVKLEDFIIEESEELSEQIITEKQELEVPKITVPMIQEYHQQEKRKTSKSKPKISDNAILYGSILPANKKFKWALELVRRKFWGKHEFIHFLQGIADNHDLPIMYEEKNLNMHLFSVTKILGHYLEWKVIKWDKYCELIHHFAHWNESYRNEFSNTAPRMFLNMLERTNSIGKKLPIKSPKVLIRRIKLFNAGSMLKRVNMSNIMLEIYNKYHKKHFSTKRLENLINILIQSIQDGQDLMIFRELLKAFCNNKNFQYNKVNSLLLDQELLSDKNSKKVEVTQSQEENINSEQIDQELEFQESYFEESMVLELIRTEDMELEKINPEPSQENELKIDLEANILDAKSEATQELENVQHSSHRYNFKDSRVLTCMTKIFFSLVKMISCVLAGLAISYLWNVMIDIWFWHHVIGGFPVKMIIMFGFSLIIIVLGAYITCWVVKFLSWFKRKVMPPISVEPFQAGD